MAGFTPVNQVRLTNVAYVRLTKAGKRFEIAAYRNKVLSWRNKVETDLGEVLQIDTVFANVSKGLLASSKDLQDAFGTTDQRTVCREILDKGELQVSEQERLAQIDGIFRDVAGIVADKTVNPENNRPYTISMIQNAMRQIHYSVNVSKSAKSQALDVIRRLRDVMPIARAAMLLRVVCPMAAVQEMHAFLQAEVAGVAIVPSADVAAAAPSVTPPTAPSSSTSTADAPTAASTKTIHIDLKVDPEFFRKVEEGVQALTGGEGRLEVLQLRVAAAAGASAPSSSSAAQPPPASDNETKTNGAAGKGDKAGQDKGSGKAGRKGEVDLDLPGAGGGRGRRRGGRGDDGGEDEALARALEKLGVATNGRGSGRQGHGDASDDSDDEDEDEEEDEVAYGMVTKKGAKPKKKNKGPAAQHSAPDPIDEGDEDDSDDLDHDETRSTVAATTISTLSSAGDPGAARGDRKGKTARRIEKERQAEREQRAAQLKARIELEQARVRADTAAPAATAAVTAPGPVSGAATDAAAAPTAPTAAAATESAAPTTGAGQKCNTCGGCFADAAAYRAHFRSEWHRHNLQRKLKGLPPVPSEEAFAALSLEELDRVSGAGQT